MSATNRTLLTSHERLTDVLALLDGELIGRARAEATRAAVYAERRPTITWHSPRPGCHVIDGQPVDSDLLGLMAAHLAFLSPWRQVVRAADIAAPGTANPGDVVRVALRRAARYIGPLSMRAAAAVRSVRIATGANGVVFVTYAPDGRFDIGAS